jgi:tetrahydromethanopterin S-methyltransferase subunit A
MEGSDWPVTDGRYDVGSRDSPVAVCTMATVEMDLPMDRIAIKGKCVTENIGIEKIVRNIVTNPKIRFLIFCGKDSRGHFVGQAIKSLIDNGVEGERKHIIGATGAMPELKNLTDQEISQFRKQVTAVDLAGEMDRTRIMQAVEECWNKNPGAYSESQTSLAEHAQKEAAPETAPQAPARQPAQPAEAEAQKSGPQTIAAAAHQVTDWTADPKGFFTIRPDRHRKAIFVEHYSNDKSLLRLITGKSAEDICHTIVNMNLVSRHEHAAYLGRELGKAEAALQHSLDYEQDAALKIPVTSQETLTTKEYMTEKGVKVVKKSKEITRTYYTAGRPHIVREKRFEEPEFETLRKQIGLGRAF